LKRPQCLYMKSDWAYKVSEVFRTFGLFWPFWTFKSMKRPRKRTWSFPDVVDLENT
jgi:hypothetical protein